MKKLLFGLLVLLISSSGLHAQCTAGFTALPDTTTPFPYDMVFTNTSNAPLGSTYDWHFYGGGVPATQLAVGFSNSPVVSYPGPGTYIVSLSLYNTNTFCQDSLFTSITVPGNLLTCNAFSTSTQCGSCNGTAMVTAAGGSAPYSYLWSNGSTADTLNNLCAGTYTVTVTDTFNLTSICTIQVGGSSNISLALSSSNNQPCVGESVTITANPGGSGGYSYQWNTGATSSTISVTSSGTYACTVTDSLGCVENDSTTLTYSPTTSLSMNFSNETCISCCDGTASVSASGGSGGYSYTWSNSATTASVSSLCAGIYTVTVEDTLYGCIYIDSVSIAAFNACYSISGNVDQGVLGDARVYLIQETNNVLTAIDSTLTDALGDYSFGNVCAGTYYTKAALLPTNPVFGSFIPTYYNGTALWVSANALVVSNASMNNIDIMMLSGTNSGGPGFVSGNISQGANSVDGSPVRGGRSIVSNLPFILTDENDALVSFTLSDANGNYSLSNLAFGNYKLSVDYLNKISYPLSFTLSEETPEITNADFIVNADEIRPLFPTGLQNHVQAQDIKVYPNPTNGRVEISSDQIMGELNLLSIDGRVILAQKLNANRTSLDLTELDQGSYIIQIKDAVHTEHHVLIKE